jgi:Short-chain dehydrogenase involved in D-alanine esterification of lipoteichoic acid and wall teichoic acid (D-alanine transfer protein)
MKTSQNTILITGGSAGIGFQIATLLSEKNNHVIITGRNKEKLDGAASRLRNVTPIVSDVSNAADITQLTQRMYTEFPGLNMVVNNAGHALLYDISEAGANAFEKAGKEMFTNYLSVIRLNEKLLPLLEKQNEAAIVNVSSIVAFVPGSLAGYSASKAALHSYTLSLRIALEQTSNIKVFELMPPLVNTEFSKPIGGSAGISPEVVAEEFLKALEKNQYEIHVGNTAHMYQLFLTSPPEALKAMNSGRKWLN